MRIWLRSVFNAILGRVPGRPGRPDTATRMAIDADFADRRQPTLRPRAPGRNETMATSLSRLRRWRTLACSRS
jgi:hypothetical protein